MPGRHAGNYPSRYLSQLPQSPWAKAHRCIGDPHARWRDHEADLAALIRIARLAPAGSIIAILVDRPGATAMQAWSRPAIEAVRSSPWGTTARHRRDLTWALF
jgi:hypothetical protein